MRLRTAKKILKNSRTWTIEWDENGRSIGVIDTQPRCKYRPSRVEWARHIYIRCKPRWYAKRRKLIDAQEAGGDAYEGGIPRESCPRFERFIYAEQWLIGWDNQKEYVEWYLVQPDKHTFSESITPKLSEITKGWLRAEGHAP